MPNGISGTGLAAASAGLVFLWSAIKGASVTATLRELISGKQPQGQNIYPVDIAPPGNPATGGSGGNSNVIPGATAAASQILAVAASMKGQPYAMGAGHTSNPCASSHTDCSSYVSCVLNKVGVMKGSLATGGLANIGTKVAYNQRLPGDVIVWNGGTGGGHCGIIVDGSHMWNNPCTKCGGVQISNYPYGTRTASSAIIRRVAK